MIYLWANNTNTNISSFHYAFFDEPINCPMHINYPIELLIVFDGLFKVTVNKNEYTLKNNEVILIKSMYPHEFKTLSKSSSGLVISFSPSLLEDFYYMLKNYRFEREITALSSSHISYIKELCTRRQIIYPHHLSEINTILYSITNEILYKNKLIPENCANDSIAIIQAIEYITEHYNEDVHLEDLSRILKINKTYASQIFKKYINITFNDVLNSIRINHATKMLKNSKHTISDIAFLCGFGSIRSFNRIYKKYLNITPSQFRKDNSLFNIRDDKIDYFS